MRPQHASFGTKNLYHLRKTGQRSKEKDYTIYLMNR